MEKKKAYKVIYGIAVYALFICLGVFNVLMALEADLSFLMRVFGSWVRPVHIGFTVVVSLLFMTLAKDYARDTKFLDVFDD